MNRNKKVKITKAFVFAVVLLAIVASGYFLFNHSVESQNLKETTTTATSQTGEKVVNQTADTNPFLAGIEQKVSEMTNPIEKGGVLQIVIRLFLAVILSAILAFRPRRDVPLFQRNLYVAQTQILLAVVAAALMMIVGDNTARAFAIFAAVSLVRFRTNIKDPKEITVLLISLALGLAAGVGRLDLGIALCLFSVALLRLLEYNEPEQVFRSMELNVKTRDTESTQELLKKIFKRFKLEFEVREIEPPDDEDDIGCIGCYVNLRLNLSTNYLNDLILSADRDFIEKIQWSQKKGNSHIYQ